MAALNAFRLQYQKNKVYREWCGQLNVSDESVMEITDIPFLPIEFFKSHAIVTKSVTAKPVCFTSSSTTSQVPSKHYVSDVLVYEKSFKAGFRIFYGAPKDYCILALLPNYLEREGSSLVYMCRQLIDESEHPRSGFFLW
mgnify:FL=1